MIKKELPPNKGITQEQRKMEEDERIKKVLTEKLQRQLSEIKDREQMEFFKIQYKEFKGKAMDLNGILFANSQIADQDNTFQKSLFNLQISLNLIKKTIMRQSVFIEQPLNLKSKSPTKKLPGKKSESKKGGKKKGQKNDLVVTPEDNEEEMAVPIDFPKPSKLIIAPTKEEIHRIIFSSIFVPSKRQTLKHIS